MQKGMKGKESILVLVFSFQEAKELNYNRSREGNSGWEDMGEKECT